MRFLRALNKSGQQVTCRPHLCNCQLISILPKRSYSANESWDVGKHTDKDKEKRKSKFPKYNYGLPGSGTKSKELYLQYQNKGADIKGEVIFGIHPISLALQAHNRKFYKLFVKEKTNFKKNGEMIFEMADKMEIKKEYVSKDVLRQLSGSRPNQGMCMDVSPLNTELLDPQTDLRSVFAKSDVRHPIWILAQEVQDPMNFGGILRSACFLGCNAVLVPSNNSSALNPTVSKASAGALEIMNIYSYKTQNNINLFLQNWRQAGGVIIGSSSSEDITASSFRLPTLTEERPILLIVGNEQRGVKDSMMAVCDYVVSIPGYDDGKIGSLNVSVATGIILYHLRTSSTKS